MIWHRLFTGHSLQHPAKQIRHMPFQLSHFAVVCMRTAQIGSVRFSFLYFNFFSTPRNTRDLITRLSSFLSSMGLSPPVLTRRLFDRSIIIPCSCHRHHRRLSGFRCISFIARSRLGSLPLFGRSWRTYSHGLAFHAGTSNVCDKVYIQLSKII